MKKKPKSVIEYDCDAKDRFCGRCGRCNSPIHYRTTYDTEFGGEIIHVRMTCPRIEERQWWQRVFDSYHAGDHISYDY